MAGSLCYYMSTMLIVKGIEGICQRIYDPVTTISVIALPDTDTSDGTHSKHLDVPKYGQPDQSMKQSLKSGCYFFAQINVHKKFTIKNVGYPRIFWVNS